ncbi:MAG: Bax inhibitor-1/YccA family protein [Phycisphaerae bacterium]|nr:Bax inhibitor-1/YccA family protein [Phycisphaerae bacterium]
MFRSSNPAFTHNSAFAPAQTWDDLESQGRSGDLPGLSVPARAAPSATMTVQGTVNKTFFLLALAVTTAVFAWSQALAAEPMVNPGLLLVGGAIGGLIAALVCCLAPKTAPVAAPMYALLEGLFLGAISAFYAQRFGSGASLQGGSGAVGLNTGLIFNAMLLTFGILGGLLVGYSTGLVRPGPIFRNIVVTGTIGVCAYGLIAMIAAMFGSFSLASVYDPSNGGMLSVGFSLLLVGLASGNLVMDFEFIHAGVKNGAPRRMEWFGAFGLMVSLVWLYLEVLRLLAKLRRD